MNVLSAYTHLRPIPNHGPYGIARQIFTVALVVGLDETGYVGRYCFPTMLDATKAIEEWDGEGDPPGPWIKWKGRGGDRSNIKKDEL